MIAYDFARLADATCLSLQTGLDIAQKVTFVFACMASPLARENHEDDHLVLRLTGSPIN
jgi:hypothetical protein